MQKLAATSFYIVLVSLFLPFACLDSEQHYSLVTYISALKNECCQITFFDVTLQVVKAFVVLSPTFSSSDLESLAYDLQEHVKKITAPYKYPRKVNASEEKLETTAHFYKSQGNYYLDFHYLPERNSGEDSAGALSPGNLP